LIALIVVVTLLSLVVVGPTRVGPRIYRARTCSTIVQLSIFQTVDDFLIFENNLIKNNRYPLISIWSKRFEIE